MSGSRADHSPPTTAEAASPRNPGPTRDYPMKLAKEGHSVYHCSEMRSRSLDLYVNTYSSDYLVYHQVYITRVGQKVV